MINYVVTLLITGVTADKTLHTQSQVYSMKIREPNLQDCPKHEIRQCTQGFVPDCLMFPRTPASMPKRSALRRKCLSIWIMDLPFPIRLNTGPVFPTFYCGNVYKIGMRSICVQHINSIIYLTKRWLIRGYLNSYILDLLDFIYSIHKGGIRSKFNPNQTSIKQAKWMWFTIQRVKRSFKASTITMY